MERLFRSLAVVQIVLFTITIALNFLPLKAQGHYLEYYANIGLLAMVIVGVLSFIVAFIIYMMPESTEKKVDMQD